MSINAIHTIGALVIQTAAGPTTTVIRGEDNVNVDPGVAEVMLHNHGRRDPSYVGVAELRPKLTFNAFDIARTLALITVGGFQITSTGSATPTDAYFTKVNAVARATGANHNKITINDGIIVPRRITWTQGNNPAVMELEVLATYDGTNNPFVYAASATLPTFVVLDELFMGGKVTINGTELKSVVGITIDFGLTAEHVHTNGEVFPTRAHVRMATPYIELTVLDFTALSTFGLVGTAQNATDSIVSIRKVSKISTGGVARVADATAEHITFSIDDGIIYTQPFSASQGQDVRGVVRISPIEDGTNANLVINTASAIA